MKTQSTLLAGGASLLALVLAWTSGVGASVHHPVIVPTSQEDPLGTLLNRDCVVTVDPLAVPTEVIAGQANIPTGFAAPNTVEGTVIESNPEWLVLSDGCNLNWIPKDKILLIHLCP